MIYSADLLKESGKEVVNSKDFSKDKPSSGAGSLAQLFGKGNSGASDPMMERLFQNLKSLTEEGLQNVFARSNTHTASVSAVESSRSQAQNVFNSKEAPSNKPTAGNIFQRFGHGISNESHSNSQLSRRKSVNKQLSMDRSTHNSQKSNMLGNDAQSQGPKNIAFEREHEAQNKLQRVDQRDRSNLDQGNEARSAANSSTRHQLARDSSKEEVSTLRSRFGGQSTQHNRREEETQSKQSGKRGQAGKGVSKQGLKPVGGVSGQSSPSKQERSRSRSVSVSQRSGRSAKKAQEEDKRRKVGKSGSGSREDQRERPVVGVVARRKPRGGVNREEVSRSPSRMSAESSAMEQWQQHGGLFLGRGGNQQHVGSMHSAASRVVQNEGVGAKVTGGHSRSVAGLGEVRRGHKGGEDSSQRSWGVPSSQRGATGRTTFRGAGGGSLGLAAESSSLADPNASIDDFTQLEKLTEAQVAAEEGRDCVDGVSEALSSNKSSLLRYEDRLSGAPRALGRQFVGSESSHQDRDEMHSQDQLEDCKRLTIFGRSAQDSSVEEYESQDHQPPENFEDEFEQYIPNNQDLFYIDERSSSNNDPESLHDRHQNPSMHSKKSNQAAMTRQMSQLSIAGGASVKSSKSSGSVLKNSMKPESVISHSINVRQDGTSQSHTAGNQQLPPSNLFSLGTPTVGQSVATIPSQNNQSPPLSTSQHRQSTSQAGQGTDHQTSNTHQTQSYVQCLQSPNLNLGGTIPELSQEREDDYTDDPCYDSGGMYLNSHDKRVLLEKLKQNFEQNSCFDVEFLMTDKADKHRHKKLNTQQYSSSSEHTPASQSHPSTQSKPNIFQANWGANEEGDSLDIDDRRVLFESEVRKQIHRNAPFEETEGYARLELLHKLSKEHKGLAKIDSVDTERSKLSDMQSLEAIAAGRFGGSSFDGARLHDERNYFDPEGTMQLKAELAGVDFQTNKTNNPSMATLPKPKVTGVTVGLVEPTNLKNPEPYQDLHSFRQKLDSSRQPTSKSIDEVKLSVSSPNVKQGGLHQADQLSDNKSLSGTSEYSRKGAATKSNKAKSNVSAPVDIKEVANLEKNNSSRSKGSLARTGRSQKQDRDDDKDDKATVRTLRSGGEKQMEELRNMFFDSNPEELQDQLAANQPKKQDRPRLHRNNGAILESFGDDDEDVQKSPQLSVSLHHPDAEEPHAASVRASKSKSSVQPISKSANQRQSLHHDEDIGDEITDQMSQSIYSMISANHIDMRFDRNKLGNGNHKALPRNSTAAHIFLGTNKQHLGSLGVETNHHAQSVSTHKKLKHGQPMTSLRLNHPNPSSNQRRSMQVEGNAVHLSLELHEEDEEDPNIQPDDNSKEISLVELNEEQHIEHSPKLKYGREQAPAVEHSFDHPESRKSFQQLKSSKPSGLKAIVDRVNSCNESFRSDILQESPTKTKPTRPSGENTHSPKIMPRPILRQEPSMASELSEEDRQLKELTDYYLGVGGNEPSMIQAPSRSAQTSTQGEGFDPKQPKMPQMAKQPKATVTEASAEEKSLSLFLAGQQVEKSSPSRVSRHFRGQYLPTDTAEKQSRNDSSIPTLSAAKLRSKENTIQHNQTNLLRTSLDGLEAGKEVHTRFYGPGMTSSSGFFSMKEENPFPSGTMEEDYLLENLTEILGGNEATPAITIDKTTGRGENSSLTKPKRLLDDRWRVQTPVDKRRSRSGSKEDRIEVMQKIIYQLEEENRQLKAKAFPQLSESSPGRGQQILSQWSNNKPRHPSKRVQPENMLESAGFSLSEDSKENMYDYKNAVEARSGLVNSQHEYLKLENGSATNDRTQKGWLPSSKQASGGHKVEALGSESQTKKCSRLSDLQNLNQPVVVQTFKSLVDYFPQAGYTHLHLLKKSHRKTTAQTPLGR